MRRCIHAHDLDKYMYICAHVCVYAHMDELRLQALCTLEPQTLRRVAFYQLHRVYGVGSYLLEVKVLPIRL